MRILVAIFLLLNPGNARAEAVRPSASLNCPAYFEALAPLVQDREWIQISGFQFERFLDPFMYILPPRPKEWDCDSIVLPEPEPGKEDQSRHRKSQLLNYELKLFQCQATPPLAIRQAEYDRSKAELSEFLATKLPSAHPSLISRYLELEHDSLLEIRCPSVGGLDFLSLKEANRGCNHDLDIMVSAVATSAAGDEALVYLFPTNDLGAPELVHLRRIEHAWIVAKRVEVSEEGYEAAD